MKRNLFLLAFTLLYAISAFAEHHVIEVQRFPQWAHQYLTVANTWGGWYLLLEDGNAPQCMDVITEVNGVTTEGMPEGTFYEILNTSEKLKLKFLRKQNGKVVEGNCTIKDATRELYFPGGIDYVTVDKLSNEIRFASDADIDYWDYNTYDFVVGKDDPLTVKNILVELSKMLQWRGLARSSNNPDIYITFTKSLDQNAQVSSSVVNDGSVSGIKTNAWTGQQFLVQENMNKVVTTTNVAATFHSSVIFLDGRKYRENPESNPVVWQCNYDKYSDEAINIMSEVKNGISYCVGNYPFDRPKYSVGFYASGLVTREKDFYSGYIYGVIKDSEAYQNGFRSGDQVVKAYEAGFHLIMMGSYRATYFKANSNRRKGRHWCYFYMLPLFPGSGCKCPENVLSELPAYRAGVSTAAAATRLRFVVKHANGSKFKYRGLPALQKGFIPCEYVLTDN